MLIVVDELDRLGRNVPTYDPRRLRPRRTSIYAVAKENHRECMSVCYDTMAQLFLAESQGENLARALGRALQSNAGGKAYG